MARTPFLLSPSLEYDVLLNGFFQSVGMVASAWNTQAGYARDLAAFLTFLWSAREGRSWREATEADHRAYLFWRRRDLAGPRVSGAAWDREVAAVNRFYRWALRAGHVRVNPIPQTSRRPAPLEAGWAHRGTLDEQRPATYSHDAARERSWSGSRSLWSVWCNAKQDLGGLHEHRDPFAATLNAGLDLTRPEAATCAPTRPPANPRVRRCR